MISRPSVPCPAITSGWSNGEMSVIVAASRSTSRCASSWPAPAMRTSAPSASTAATLFAGTSVDMHTVAFTPAARLACATARPWLPVDAVTTPFRRTSSDSDSTALVAPRSLKLPVSCWCSHFRKTSAPRRRPRLNEGRRGVRKTLPAMRCLALRISVKAIIGDPRGGGALFQRTATRRRNCRINRRRRRRLLPPRRPVDPSNLKSRGSRSSCRSDQKKTYLPSTRKAVSATLPR